MRRFPWPDAARATWGICVLGTAAVLVLLAATGTYVQVASLVIMAGLILILLGLHVVYTRFRPDRFVGPITGGLAVVIWAGCIAAVAALTALRAGAPLVDPMLARADAMLGIDTPAVVAWLARYSPVWLLNVAYMSTAPLVFAAVVILGWSGREAMMWGLCLTFAGSAVSCALFSVLTPAAGAFAHYDIANDVLALLPSGAGLYHLPTFFAYWSGSLDTVDMHHFEGVVTFPSFHTAMALMTAYALRDMRWLFVPACVWSGLALISTIPIGGHYAVDLLAGAVVWAVFALPYGIVRDADVMRPAGARPRGRPNVACDRRASRGIVVTRGSPELDLPPWPDPGRHVAGVAHRTSR
jgi:membrane-associated phospholipid phosphatase